MDLTILDDFGRYLMAWGAGIVAIVAVVWYSRRHERSDDM